MTSKLFARGLQPWMLSLVFVLGSGACGDYESSYAFGRLVGRILMLVLVGWAAWYFLRRRRRNRS